MYNQYDPIETTCDFVIYFLKFLTILASAALGRRKLLCLEPGAHTASQAHLAVNPCWAKASQAFHPRTGEWLHQERCVPEPSHARGHAHAFRCLADSAQTPGRFSRAHPQGAATLLQLSSNLLFPARRSSTICYIVIIVDHHGSWDSMFEFCLDWSGCTNSQ